MSAIHFTSEDDATGLVTVLKDKGYQTTLLHENFTSDDGSDDREWVLMVEPLDDDVQTLAHSHGGWTPHDDAELDAAAGFNLPDAPPRLAPEG